MSEFTQKLNPGDFVIVGGGGGMHRDSVEQVDRLTKTQIILKSGLRFRRDDGHQIGGSTWSTIYLMEATEELLAKLRHDKEHRTLVHKLSNVKWHQMTLDELRNVYNSLST